MTVYLSRLAIALSVLLTSLLLFMHTQPYDNHALNELFSDACNASCFMNIHVGITTDEEALTHLKNNAWVKASSVQLLRLPPSSSRFDELSHIQWDWDASRPDSLVINPQLPDGNLNIRNHVVESIAFDSTLPAAALYYYLGSPSSMFFGTVHNRDPWQVQWVYQYAAAQFNFEMQVRACPYLADLWLQPLHIFIVNRPDTDVKTPTAIAFRIRLPVVLNYQKRMMCRVS